jgi:signal transduction histidine kinase/DNA-binding NarL/FixJ family response regulator
MLVLFAGAMVLATCVTGIWMWWRLQEAISRRTHTRAMLIAWQTMCASVKDAEISVLGFILSGEDEALRPFEAAEAALPAQMSHITGIQAQLQQAFGEDEAPARLAEFEARARPFYADLREIIDTRRRDEREKAALLSTREIKRSHADTLHAHSDAVLRELDQRVRSLDAQMASSLQIGGRALSALGIAAIVAGMAAWAMLLDAAKSARRAELLHDEKQQSEQASQQKSSFLATMSHEIRTPLNAILGFGELLMQEALNDKKRRYAESIVRSGRSLLQLINDLLDLSKIEAGMVEITRTPVNVRELAEFARQLFSLQCASKGVELRVQVDDDVPQSLLLDGARLRQVLLNLAGNAIKFTTQGHVRLHFHGGHATGLRDRFALVLEVADTGSGIPAARLEDIFEPFVQAKATRDAEMKGTGLGLAIVKRLTRLMGGTVTVRSEEGKGSTFIVTLPQVPISARPPASTETRHEEADFNQLTPSKILIVDDNPVNLALAHGYFDSTHHAITTAANGREALDRMHEHRPDIVLMDIRMPVMDGRTALHELRQRRDLATLPVIAVTASSMSAEEGELRSTFDGYVRKPYSRAELFEEMARFIQPHTAGLRVDTAAFEMPAKTAWQPLATRLREIAQQDWPAVREGMALSEVTRFAAMLRSLAQSAECPPLETLATRIHSLAESFALDELEETLASFPDFITRLERRIESTFASA